MRTNIRSFGKSVRHCPIVRNKLFLRTWYDIVICNDLSITNETIIDVIVDDLLWCDEDKENNGLKLKSLLFFERDITNKNMENNDDDNVMF